MGNRGTRFFWRPGTKTRKLRARTRCARAARFNGFWLQAAVSGGDQRYKVTNTRRCLSCAPGRHAGSLRCLSIPCKRRLPALESVARGAGFVYAAAIGMEHPMFHAAAIACRRCLHEDFLALNQWAGKSCIERQKRLSANANPMRWNQWRGELDSCTRQRMGWSAPRSTRQRLGWNIPCSARQRLPAGAACTKISRPRISGPGNRA